MAARTRRSRRLGCSDSASAVALAAAGLFLCEADNFARVSREARLPGFPFRRLFDSATHGRGLPFVAALTLGFGLPFLDADILARVSSETWCPMRAALTDADLLARASGDSTRLWDFDRRSRSFCQRSFSDAESFARDSGARPWH